MNKLTDRLTYIPLDQITASDGIVQVYRDHWWIVDPEKGLLIYDKSYPQCNPYEYSTRKLAEKLWPGTEVKQIPLVLFKINPRDYI